MRLLRNICICVILFLTLFSCGKRARIIPKKEMAKIYAEMYVADQWLISHANYRSQADTSFFYEPIFQKYGYTTEDYRKSVYHYLKDAKRYSAILESSADLIKKELDAIKAIQKAEDIKRKRLERIADYKYYDEFEDISYFNLLKDDILIPNAIKVELDSSKLNKTVVIKVFRDTLNFEQAFEKIQCKDNAFTLLDSLIKNNNHAQSEFLNKVDSRDSLLRKLLEEKDFLAAQKYENILTKELMQEIAEELLEKTFDELKTNAASDSVKITKATLKTDSLKNSSAKLLKERMEKSKPLLDTTTHLVRVAK